jgi:2-succinyl-6-hydroxy-2,4-cyclohexadiene-1-carboxylate synthase
MTVTVVRIGPQGAPRVTLIPGFMGGPRSWDAVVHHLPDALTIRIVTLPGHGDRPVVMPRAGFPEVVSEIGRSLVAQNNRDVPEVLVGYSMGGRIALSLALLEPARFASVIAIGADLGLSDEAVRAARCAEDDERARSLEEAGLEEFVARWETLPIFESQRELPEELLASQRRMRLANTTEGLAFALRALGTGAMPDLRSALGAFERPLAFAVGSRDKKFCALAEEGARIAPRGERIVFSDVGHNVALEAPKRLARVIADRASRARAEADTSFATNESTQKSASVDATRGATS